jgi:hypothetical protein
MIIFRWVGDQLKRLNFFEKAESTDIISINADGKNAPSEKAKTLD